MNDWDYWDEDSGPEPPSLWDKRRRTFRWIAVIVVIAMILALVVPVIVRVIRRPEPQDRGTVTVLHDPPSTNARAGPGASALLPNLSWRNVPREA
jgi:hypothetical protein